MRRALLFPLALIVCWWIGSGPARSQAPKSDDKKEKPGVKLPTQAEVMAAKLKSAHAALDGLATADFAKVQKSADELVRISQAGEFLNAMKTREYEIQAGIFRRSAETLSKKAKDKNLDGVLVAYMDLTMTCVRCHEHTRAKPDARLPVFPQPNLAGR